MNSPRDNLLIQYRYDPMDRLADCSPTELPSHQRFYQKSRLATEIHGQIKHSFFQGQDILLAQQQHQGATTDTTLLATDSNSSVLHALEKTQQSAIVYAPYGHRVAGGGLLSLLGFNGERTDPVTGHYLLGNGYRAFNPVLMRFNSPDSLSPFGRGGLNVYAYAGDPINTVDPTGHFGIFHAIRSLWKGAQNILNLRTPGGAANAARVVPTPAATRGTVGQQFTVHGVELEFSGRGKVPGFVRRPTTPYKQLERPLPQNFDTPEIIGFDRALSAQNAEIIHNERTLVTFYKDRILTLDQLNNSSGIVKEQRRVFAESYNKFQEKLNRAILAPPPYEPPPSYSSVVQNASGIRDSGGSS